MKTFALFALGVLSIIKNTGAFVPMSLQFATTCTRVRVSGTRAFRMMGRGDTDIPVGGAGTTEDDGACRGINRKRWLQAASTAAVAAAAAGLAPISTVNSRAMAQPSAAVAAQASSPLEGLPASGYFVQHAVFNVRDMDAEIKFFTEGLGMKVMRQRDVGGVRNVFVAYGPESLKVKDGGYFSLELVYNPKSPPGIPAGGAFQYLGITVPTTLAMVAYKANEAGGEMVPHWFATTNYVEVTSPAGITVRVHEGKRRDPVGVVAFATSNESKARAYLHDVLGMKEQDTGLLKLLGPLVGEANRLYGYDRGGVSIALNPVDVKIQKGGRFDKLAVLTKDTQALAARVSGSGGAKQEGGDVLFAGEVPGIGTKVANTIDFEGRGVVFVDYEDFEKEMAPVAA